MGDKVRMSILGCSTIAATAVIAMGAAACGATPEPAAGQNGVPTDTATTAARTSPTRKQLTVAVDKTHYAQADTITVTITNGLAMTISTTDHQTNCTVVTLERLIDGAWQPEGVCRLMTPTHIVPIPPGVTVEQLGSTAWPAGTYRVAFHYFMGLGEQPGQGAIVYSAIFTIG